MLNRADTRILKTQRIVDQLWILARIPDCACLDVWILGPKQNLDHRSFFSLGRYANEFIQILNETHSNSWSDVRLLMELYCVIVIKHVAFFRKCTKLTMTFTFTSLPLNFYNSVSRCGCGFGFEQKYCRIDGFGGEKARIGGFVHPCLPPSKKDVCMLLL